MRKILPVVIAATLGACATTPAPTTLSGSDVFYGTLEPFASEAIYFVVTDRFVNGDTSNDHRDQGGAHRTFDIPITGPKPGDTDNIGYLGGDFKGILNNADYLRNLGFGAVWITPITDNPDEAFSGGDPVSWASGLTDRGKTGYHGYWSDNFYQLDEHLPSRNLDFAAFTKQMRDKGLKTVLDIVANHGSPAWTMPVKQPKFGQIFDADGKLVADEDNLPPEQLDPKNPLQAFYKNKPILAQLSNIDDNNPATLDYFVGAYAQWIAQGADAFRIDAIGLTPVAYWKQFSERIRADHPGFFMFGENFDYDAKKIAPYTRSEGGAITVLDFPLKKQIAAVFENPHSDYAKIPPALFLEKGPYRNPYELITFYDNHDMARLDATDEGFIDAHNWLFTARGIPVIYYGSEIGFMRGRPEHAGNRNYFGQERIDAAAQSPIYQQLKRIANLRNGSVALQRGLQLNVAIKGDTAVFYRVFENSGINQTALVVLNKGGTAATIEVKDFLQSGHWRDGFSAEGIEVTDKLKVKVPAHGAQVYFYDAPVTRADLRARLAKLMFGKSQN
jgi:cyclomaltodextrin glucanotransferase